MKKLNFYLVSIIMVLSFISCDNEEGISNAQLDNNSILTKKSSSKLAEDAEKAYKLDLENFMGSKNYITVSGGGSSLQNKATEPIQQVFGPFTPIALSYMSANTTVLLATNEYFAVGYYNCRIRTFRASVLLPYNAAPFVNSVTPVLFSNPYNQTMGYSYTVTQGATPTSDITLKIQTSQLLVDNNILGQQINATLPFALSTAPVMKYSYFLIN